MRSLLHPPSSLPVSPPAAFTISRAQEDSAPVVFTSPHSGRYYPPDLQQQLQVPLLDLRRTEDAFIDDLFAGAPAAGATLITAHYARGYVDLNRDARDLDPTMFADGLPRPCGRTNARVRAGLGCLPRVGASGREIYAKPLTCAEGAFRLQHVHDGYHQAVSDCLDQLKQSWRDVVLIDCHSMPSTQPGRSGLPDIVLGDRFGSSCTARLTSLIERSFRQSGLRVVRNAPYAGGYTTRRYGRPRRGVHALQIEINRGLYMDEQSIETTAGFEKIQGILTDTMQSIIGFARRMNG